MRVWIFVLFLWPLFAQPLLQVADSLLKQGRYAAALTLYDSLLRTQPMPDSLRLRVYLKGAEAWADLEKPQEALRWLAPGETLALRLGDMLGYAELLCWKGLYYRQSQAYAEAEAVLQEAFRLVERREAQRSPLYALVWRRWGILASDQGRHEEAEERFLRAAQVLEALGLVEHPDYAWTLNNLAAVYEAQGRYAAAESLHLKVKAIRAKVLGPEHPDYIQTLNNLANLYAEQRRYVEAESLYLQVQALQAKVVGIQHPDYLQSLRTLANLYKRQHEYEKAEALYHRINALRAQGGGLCQCGLHSGPQSLRGNLYPAG